MIVLSLFKGLIDVPNCDPDNSRGSLRLTDRIRDGAIADAAAFFDVSPSEIYPGRSRMRSVAHARQLSCFLLREMRRANGLRSYSLPEIGRGLGLNHTSVLWAIRCHVARRDGVALIRPCHQARAA